MCCAWKGWGTQDWPHGKQPLNIDKLWPIDLIASTPKLQFWMAGLSFQELDTKFWRRRRVQHSDSDVILRSDSYTYAKPVVLYICQASDFDWHIPMMSKDKALDEWCKLPAQDLLVFACLRCQWDIAQTTSSRRGGWTENKYSVPSTKQEIRLNNDLLAASLCWPSSKHQQRREQQVAKICFNFAWGSQFDFNPVSSSDPNFNHLSRPTTFRHALSCWLHPRLGEQCLGTLSFARSL